MKPIAACSTVDPETVVRRFFVFTCHQRRSAGDRQEREIIFAHRKSRAQHPRPSFSALFPFINFIIFLSARWISPSRFHRSADGRNSSARDVTRDDGRCVTAFLPGGAGQSSAAIRSRGLRRPIGDAMQFNRRNVF